MTCQALFTVLLLLSMPAVLLAQTTSSVGMSLAEALQQLQSRGLRIVFSSAIVTSDLRVPVEPRASTPREQLDELLAPHGLTIRDGPGGTLQVVRITALGPRQRRDEGSLEGQVVDARTANPLAGVLVRVDGHERGTSPETRRYHEFVSVSDFLPARADRGVASESSLERDDFARLAGSIAEDPLRIIHTFPGTTAVDDFQSDIIVRASPFRHTALVIDGVSAHWLRHTVFGRGPSGSLMMLSGLVVERATLRTGAYPRRHGDYLGSELDMQLRQGSRSELVLHGVVGGAHAVLAAEGPLGRRGPDGSAPGSWLVSGRQSYLEWPPERSGSSRTPFGFSDGVAKVVFDVRPRQQLTMTAITGVSSIDEDEENLGPGDLAAGTTRASAVAVSWEASFGAGTHVSQQASIVRQRFWNSDYDGHEREGGANGSLAYRADFSRVMSRGRLEAGGLVERIRTSRAERSPNPISMEGSSWQRSGFAHFSWAVGPTVTISPGARLTWSSTTSAPAVSRWLLTEWSFRRGWSLMGSFGASRQVRDLGTVVGESGPATPGPERAVHWEAGVEHEPTNDIRWRASMFDRQEADVLQAFSTRPIIVGDVRVTPARAERYANTLSGTSRGFELMVARRSSRRLSGWITYTYARTRHRDAARGETFWADYDQRHTFNLFAQYRLLESTTLSTTFRAGSNFPIAGYFSTRGERLFVGTERNTVRLPPYLRLDVRADHQLRHFGRRFAIFVEVVNAFDRANTGLATGTVNPFSGEAVGFTERLLRRHLSGGIVFAF